ncbi:hypothetical protein [Serratia symbiotica]|uniref:hypothetical protein n=1 Tax=Serratia symbiotica TaxID=138074 RepID=UPI001323FE87|nr:hypothetical protein [Serratia symbiotica]QTP13385.1 hypothetical protein GPZ83_0000155 [Serratia symbiotica]
MAILEFVLQVILLPFCLVAFIIIKFFEFLRATCMWLASILFILYGLLIAVNQPPLANDNSFSDAALITGKSVAYLFIAAGSALFITLIGLMLFRLFKPSFAASKKGT